MEKARWRFVVYHHGPKQEGRSPARIVVMIGECDRATQVPLIIQNLVNYTREVKSGTPVLKRFDCGNGYACDAFRSDSNGYEDIGRITLGRDLDDIWPGT